jgi:DNA-binding LytR/AlgR family response regulator
VKRLKVLIVEDEPLSARRLRRMLTELPNVEVAGVAPDGLAAARLVPRLQPDVVMLDIEMPGLSGLALARSLAEAGPAIVFVTAFSRHAAEAFELAAADYVLKPVELPRLRQALARAERRLAEDDQDARIAELTRLVTQLRGEGASAEPQQAALWVTKGRTRTRLPIQEIEWVAAERDYVRLHSGGGAWLRREPLARLLARLEPLGFVQVHRSAAVRTASIREIATRSGGRTELVLESGAVVPVSRRLARRVRTL